MQSSILNRSGEKETEQPLRYVHPAGIVLFSICLIMFFTYPVPLRAQYSENTTGTTSDNRQDYQEVLLPLIINNSDVSSSLPVRIYSPELIGSGNTNSAGQQSTITVQKEHLFSLLSTIVSQQTFDELQLYAEQKDWISPALLRQADLEMVFEPAALTVRMTVPLHTQKVHPLSVEKKGGTRGETNVLSPSPFSAQLNLSADAGVIMQEPGFQFPYAIRAEAVFNLYGWVLEGGVVHGFEGEPNSFYVEPRTIRLIKDVESALIRLSIGDVSYAVEGFQRFQQLQGISINRYFAMSPDRIHSKTGERELVLDFPSTVEVFINDKKIRTFDLGTGRYRLQDLSIGGGVNRVRLQITDIFGNTKEEEFTIPFDARLVPEGDSLFSYAVGIPQYSLELPKVSGFHLFGLTNKLTGGFNFQLSFEQQMLGLNLLFATTIGNVGMDFALSNNIETGVDTAMRLQYSYTDVSQPYVPDISFGMTYMGEHFGGFGQLNPSNQYSFLLKGFVGWQLPFNMSLNVGANYNLGRDDNRNAWGVSVTANKPLGLGTAVRVAIDGSTTKSGDFTWRGSISISSRLSGMKSSVSVNQDIQSGRTTVTWNRSPQNKWNGLSLSAGLSGWPAHPSWAQTAYASANFTGHRFNADMRNTFLSYGRQNNTVTNRLTVRIASSLVFVNGHFGLSSPVRDSFALFVAKKSLQDGTVGINPVSESYAAVTDGVGPPVYSTLNSYKHENLFIESPDLPVEYSLGDSIITVRPTYRSGIFIEVGVETTVYVSGTILGENGKPVSLQLGELRERDEESEPVTFFTDRDGIFYIYDVYPGTYELLLYKYPDLPHTITISEDATGIVELGSITLPVQP